MSDSDDDSLPNNVFTYQNDNTTISAKGPNINNTNITGLSFRNNVLTSTMHMPVNFDRRRYGDLNFDQRSMYYRRGTSPMSLRSVPNYGQSNFNCSTYQKGMGVKRSIYNERGGSAMSVHSIDSTASVSAADIVFAFKNLKFNKYDLRMIKEAYNQLIKTRQRKRIEKRRNLKMILKGTHRKFGEDSGEQGSDSSISSDDCRSVRTTTCRQRFKENIPCLRQMRDVPNFNRNMEGGINRATDISHHNNNMKEIFTDCTESIKQKTLKNMMSVSSNVSNINTKEKLVNTMGSQNLDISREKPQNLSIMTQKERFKKGFLLPSHRFSKTSTVQTQGNNNNHESARYSEKNKVHKTKPSMEESGSDQEEIFNELSLISKSTQNVPRKRALDTEEFCNSNRKKNKIDSPNSQRSESTGNDISNGNDFNFVKPNMPVKRGYGKKDFIPEKLLAKSRVPPIAEEIDINFGQSIKKPTETENIKEHTHLDSLDSNSDVSMRPSFIKRKLFTQKLDVAEHKNPTSDHLEVSSPQNIYSASIREKNRARKLVASQSCLSRDIPGEDNNFLDLIHKIVPSDQINSTNVANKTESCNNKSNSIDNSSKWDVTAVIASCNNEDVSDTYTDEEIFNGINAKKSKQSSKSEQSTKKSPQCKVVQKLLPATLSKCMKNHKNDELSIKLANKETSKKSVTDCVKSFWDTDIESDVEFNVASSWKTTGQINQGTVLQKRNIDFDQSQSSKKTAASKGVILTIRNCHKESTLHNNTKSDRSQVISDKKNIQSKKPNSVVQKKNNVKVVKNNNDTKSSPQTGKKKNTVKENVPVNNKNEEMRRKLKAKECVDCNKDKPINTTKKVKEINLAKPHDNLDNKTHLTKPLNSENLSVKTTLKSKDCKSLDPQNNKAAKNKIVNSGQKNNDKSHKEPVSNIRTQPKRKSKEKSFIQCSILKTVTKNTRAPKKELVSNNTSMYNISTMTTRSTAKLSFNSSQSDYSNLNISDISNRSLRLQQRILRNRN